MSIHRSAVMRLRLREVVFVDDAEPLECFMCLVMLLCGIWLLLPYDTFVGMTSYHPLVGVLDERLAGVIALALGLLRGWFLLDNRISPRRILAVIYGGFWGANCALAFAPNQGSLLCPIYASFFVASVWLAFRLQGAGCE